MKLQVQGRPTGGHDVGVGKRGKAVQVEGVEGGQAGTLIILVDIAGHSFDL
jgi:hypothetical protein